MALWDPIISIVMQLVQLAAWVMLTRHYRKYCDDLERFNRRLLEGATNQMMRELELVQIIAALQKSQAVEQ